MPEAEKLKRDKWEQGLLKANKPIPYDRTTRQVNAAVTNVQANANNAGKDTASVRSTSSERRKRDAKGGKGKGQKGGKGKDALCRVFQETGACPRGQWCWFAKTTPNHP